ncbi:MAG: SUMF1/EgtB/PvdO family nonheme iron enzyme [Planctomycetota bacterium]|nr:SUMF1/EgtB/PvdO family nonheme iron enzyme [Planctomycetota bacterium]
MTLQPDAPKVQPAPRLWDGRESMESYARHVDLAPTKVIKLPGGGKLELVLIPAGQFTMGTPGPKPPQDTVFLGQVILVAGIAAAVAMFVLANFRAVIRRRRMQFSLGWLVGFVVCVGVAMLGATQWWQTDEAWREYAAAMARYRTALKSETPAHSVTLTRPFYMGKYEVTQEQHEAVMRTLPCTLIGLDFPVVNVTWDEAQEFCRRVGDFVQETVRLPTEAEWEFAARAGTNTIYYSGDTEPDLLRVACCDTPRSKSGALQFVGRKEPNRFGLYDMLGNAWEWCLDNSGAYTAEPATDPVGRTDEENEVHYLRGGAFAYNADFCRCARRFVFDGSRATASRVPDAGFRIVLEPAAPTQ